MGGLMQGLMHSVIMTMVVGMPRCRGQPVRKTSPSKCRRRGSQSQLVNIELVKVHAKQCNAKSATRTYPEYLRPTSIIEKGTYS